MITLSFLRWMLETGYTIGVDITHSWMGDKLFFWTGLAYANTFNQLRIRNTHLSNKDDTSDGL